MSKKKIRFNRVAARNHSVPADEGMQFLDAVEEGDIATAELFIDKYGPEILDVCAKDWMKPGNVSIQSDTKNALMKAVSEDNIAMAEMLIGRGADVNATMGEGYTVLMLSKGDAMAGLLLDKGVDLEAVNNSGGTVLMWPNTPGDLKFFLSRGANVHARDKEGKTALIRIGDGNYVRKDALPSEHINILLDAGSEIDAQDNNGRTALIAAASRSAYEDQSLLKVATLLRRGADPDIRDKEGNTAAMLASRPRPDLDANEAQQKAVAELLEQESERRAEKLHKALTEGGDDSIVVYKPIQFNLRKC